MTMSMTTRSASALAADDGAAGVEGAADVGADDVGGAGDVGAADEGPADVGAADVGAADEGTADEGTAEEESPSAALVQPVSNPTTSASAANATRDRCIDMVSPFLLSLEVRGFSHFLTIARRPTFPTPAADRQ
jgi:hypothetical protein